MKPSSTKKIIGTAIALSMFQFANADIAITFANPKSMDDDGMPLTWDIVNHAPDTQNDGTDYFWQTNTEVALALIAIDTRSMEICKECDDEVTLFANTSAGITAEDTRFSNGIAIVRLRSEKEYTTETAFITVGIVGTEITATYGNMHFRDEPSALPQNRQANVEPLPATYTVMDMQGRIIRKGIAHSAGIDMSALAPGRYIVKLGSTYRRMDVR